MDGVLLINKPINITSHQALNNIKRFYQSKKVGHAGTLDPFAEGLLLVCVNKATKIVNYLEGLNKEYVATLKLGEKTDTGDLSGNITATKPVPTLNEEIVKEIFKQFLGVKSQIPPMYSALKVKGKKLYEYARQGVEIERKARVIEIFALDLISLKDNELTFKALVSKGTYLRTLGEDIALALNTIGHLKTLKRTKVGPFSLDKAVNIDELTEAKPLSISKALSNITKVIITTAEQAKIKNGMPLFLPFKDDIILLVDELDEALAIYKWEESKYKSVRGLW